MKQHELHAAWWLCGHHVVWRWWVSVSFLLKQNFEVDGLGIFLFLKFSSFITGELDSFITGALNCLSLTIRKVVQKECRNSNGQEAKGQAATRGSGILGASYIMLLIGTSRLWYLYMNIKGQSCHAKNMWMKVLQSCWATVFPSVCIYTVLLHC